MAAPFPSSPLDDVDALSREGEEALASSSFSLSEACFTAALDIWTAAESRAALHTRRAETRLVAGNQEGAISDAKRAIALSDTPQAQAILRKAQEAQSRSEKGHTALPPVGGILSAFLSVLEDGPVETLSISDAAPEQGHHTPSKVVSGTDADVAHGLLDPPQQPDPKLDDETIIARLEALGADWRAAPAKLRILLQENGTHGVSEKRLKALKLRSLPTVAVTAAAPVSDQRHPDDAADWGMEIESRQGRGRCAIAIAPMKAGTVVKTFSGKPYESCLLPAQQVRRCQACYDEAPPGSKLLKCAKCGFACWCSARCRAADASRHAHECSVLAKPSAALKALRAEGEPMGGSNLGRFGVLLLAVRCLWRRHDGHRNSGGAEMDGEEAFHDRLFDGLAQGPITEQDEEVGQIAAAMPSFLPPGCDGKRVSRLLGCLRINMISIASRQHVQHSPDAEGNSVIGVGCYPRTAILNHSCKPNCVLAYVGGGATLHVRTVRRIEESEELCHSYTDLCTPTRLRQQALSNRYGFMCDCPRCKGLQYDGEDVDFLMEAVVGHGGDGAAGERDVDELIRLSESQLAKAESTADLALAAKLTKQALELRRTHCHPLSLLRHHAEQAAFELAVRSGRLEDARESCLAVLAFLEMALSHVPWHPALSLERYQAAMLEARLGHGARASDLIGKAVAALEITHGSEHALTQRAIARRGELANKAKARGGART